MTQNQIQFTDGEAYERYMGLWSRLAGDAFLAWLDPRPGQRWLDVGCGNGAFTEMLAHRCAPATLDGIDPSEAQLAFARGRPALKSARFQSGDAQSLPYPDRSVDQAVMPLVIFFVPDPAKGVAEMARVAAKGGTVSSYSWDMIGGGFPYAPLMSELKAMGIEVPQAPNPQASRMADLRELWTGAGLKDVATQEIAVQRTFADFEDYWSTVLGGPSVGGKLAALSPEDTQKLRETLRARLPANAAGRITLGARAHAVRGEVG